MKARVRKAIGGLGIVGFVILYAVAAATIGDHIPKVIWAQALFYIVAGTAWGLPLIPLILWMNRGR